MDLARQKEIINNKVFNFNNQIDLCMDYTLEAEWFVSDGDRWKLTRSDGKIIGNYLTFDQADLIINTLAFYLGD